MQSGFCGSLTPDENGGGLRQGLWRTPMASPSTRPGGWAPALHNQLSPEPIALHIRNNSQD